jgi:tetratricopeptide (TPR) repeat protein
MRWLLVLLAMIMAWNFGVGAARAASNALPMGVQALQKQDFAAALEHLTDAVQVGEHLGEVYGHRCIAQLMLNAPERAVDDCSMSAHMASGYPRVYFYRGLAQYRLGNFAAAIADFSQHLQTTTADARAYYNRGLAYFAQSEVGRAIADYHQALTLAAGLQPLEMSNLYNDLGVAYLSISKLPEARLALDQAVSLGDNDLRAYFNRGCVCHHQGYYAAALENFDYVLTQNPHHADSYLSRGLSRQQLGDRAGAESDFRAAIQQFQIQDNLVGLQHAKLKLIQLQAEPSAIG